MKVELIFTKFSVKNIFYDISDEQTHLHSVQLPKK